MVQQETDQKDPSCKDTFEFAMRQRVTPGVKITLSLEKLDTQNIGYHHPSVPLSAMKASPAYME